MFIDAVLSRSTDEATRWGNMFFKDDPVDIYLNADHTTLSVNPFKRDVGYSGFYMVNDAILDEILKYNIRISVTMPTDLSTLTRSLKVVVENSTMRNDIPFVLYWPCDSIPVTVFGKFDDHDGYHFFGNDINIPTCISVANVSHTCYWEITGLNNKHIVDYTGNPSSSIELNRLECLDAGTNVFTGKLSGNAISDTIYGEDKDVFKRELTSALLRMDRGENGGLTARSTNVHLDIYPKIKPTLAFVIDDRASSRYQGVNLFDDYIMDRLTSDSRSIITNITNTIKVEFYKASTS